MTMFFSLICFSIYAKNVRVLRKMPFAFYTEIQDSHGKRRERVLGKNRQMTLWIPWGQNLCQNCSFLHRFRDKCLTNNSVKGAVYFMLRLRIQKAFGPLIKIIISIIFNPPSKFLVHNLILY